MPASYPNNVKTFTTKVTGQRIEASHVNELQDEVTAIEAGLLTGIAHALFPNVDLGQDLGTVAKRWRELLVQRLSAGATAATRLRITEAGGSTWITVNATFDGTNWNREDTAQPAQAIEINANKEVKYYRAAAGTNPITWTNTFSVLADRITAPQAVFGTDPGGTETLRAQNARLGATTLTGSLTAPSAVIGTDPGGTEVLRTHNLRAGATTLTGSLNIETGIGSTAATVQGFIELRGDSIYGGTGIKGNPNGGFTEIHPNGGRFIIMIPGTLTDGNPTFPVVDLERTDTWQHLWELRANGDLTVRGNIVWHAGNDGPGSGLDADTVDGAHLTDLDARYVNTTGDSMSGPLVVGPDPGGTELLRAASARLSSPVLLGPVPQFTMAADPTDSAHVATKNYVDGKYPRIINDVLVSASTTSVTIELGETIGNRTPLLIVGECIFDGVNSSQVFLRMNGRTDDYFSVWYGVGVTAGAEGPVSMARVVPRADSSRSAFVLFVAPPGNANRMMTCQWTSGGPSGGGSHPQTGWSDTITSFTFLVDTGAFQPYTRFTIWRLAP